MSDALGKSIAEAIEATLNKEARRNEQTIAVVRVFTMLGVLGIESWVMLSEGNLGSFLVPLVLFSSFYFVCSVVFWYALSRGTWHHAFQWLAPTGDALYYSIRDGTSLYVVGQVRFVEDQDLATVMGFCAVLILSSAYRLSGRSVLYASVLAVGVYLGFAVSSGLEPFFVVLQLILLSAIILATYGLTKQVLRAVRGEVRRLTVARFLPASVLERADSDPVALLSEPRSLTATVVVTDIRGFTRWAEHRSPLQVLEFLNRVQGGLAEIVQRHDGMVDKFMGDGMLAVFGAPVATEDHADCALRAIEEMLIFTKTIESLQLGVGVHSGELVVGCLGSGLRLEFTVLGDTVNTASRLEAKTKEVGVPVLISDATASSCSMPLQALDTIAIRGRVQGMQVHTLLSAGSPTP